MLLVKHAQLTLALIDTGKNVGRNVQKGYTSLSGYYSMKCSNNEKGRQILNS